MNHRIPLLTATALTLLAVAPATAHAQASQPGWITVSACTPAAPLIPTSTSESCGSDVLEPILAGLVAADPATGALVNRIAKAIETGDNRVWRVTIADGWTFHDGTPVTPDSFINAWNWAAYAPNGQSTSDWFADIDGYDEVGVMPKGATAPTAQTMRGLRRIDDKSFEITLKTPLAAFRSKLSYKAFGPLPASFFADPRAYGRHPIGAGPFQFVSGAPDTGYRLKAYPGYAGERKPQIAGIEMRVYGNAEAAYNDLVAGNLDLMRDIPRSKLVDGLWKRDLAGRVGSKPVARVEGLGMPFKAEANATLVKPDIRKALSMAIDRQAIVDIILSGAGKPATGWVPPGVEGYQPGGCGELCSYNPDKAKALFKAAGGYKGTLKIYYSGASGDKPAMEAICNSIQNTLDVVCVTAALADNASFRTLTRSGKADGPFPANWTMDYPAIDNALVPIYSAGGSSNRGFYTNPALDALFDAATTQPPAQAIETYRKAETLLRDDMPRIPLWNPEVTYGYSRKVTAVTLFSNGRPDYTALTIAR